MIEVESDIRKDYAVVVSQGKILMVKNGMPAWDDLPPLTERELITNADALKFALRVWAD